MARGVNKVILIGNLGQDPEVRFSPSGTPVANLSIATTDSWMDRQSGQRQEKTEWHRVILFNKLAEIAQQYLKKGAKLYIEGRLQTRKWQDQSGQDRYSTEIVANDMQMLEGRNGDGSQQGAYGGQQQQGGYGGQQQQGGYGGQQQGGQRPPQQQGGQRQPQQNGQGQQGGYGQNGQQQQPQQNSGNYGNGGQNPAQQQGGYGAPQPGTFDDFDDEIPF